MIKLERQARRVLRTAQQIERGEGPDERRYLRSLDRLVQTAPSDAAVELQLRQFPSNVLRTVLEKLPEAMKLVSAERRVGLRQLKKCVQRVLKSRVCIAS